MTAELEFPESLTETVQMLSVVWYPFVAEFPESFMGTVEMLTVVWYPFVAAFTGASTSVAISWGPMTSLDFLVYWFLS